MALCAIALDYYFPLPVLEDMHMGTLIGLLLTGATVVTTFAARDHCDQYIMLGDVDTTMPLAGIQVEVGGKSRINLTGSQPLVNAFAKFMMQLAGAGVLGMTLRIATGRIDQTTTYKLTNNGATTPNVYAWSEARKTGGQTPAVLDLATVGIQPASYEDFRDFSVLFITSSANVGSIDIDYADGHTESGLTVLECDAMLAMDIQTEANGRLDAVVTTISNMPIHTGDNPITRVRVNVPNGGTAVTVAVLKLDASDWQRLKSA